MRYRCAKPASCLVIPAQVPPYISYICCSVYPNITYVNTLHVRVQVLGAMSKERVITTTGRLAKYAVVSPTDGVPAHE